MSSSPLDLALSARLEQNRLSDLHRQRKVVSSPQGPVITIAGKSLLNFCSNDYLGLANHPEVVDAARKGLEQYGMGSGASHLISGHSIAHHALEEALAEFTERPRALLFSSGYMANIGVMSCLAGKGDHVFEDRLNHASLLDGGLFSGARFSRYRHNDIAHLQELLDVLPEERGHTFIVTDGVFSMDGDVAHLPKLIELAQQYSASLVVDDAHGFGCLGQTGGGAVQLFQQQGVQITEKECPVLIGTLGKAFGTSGAFVAGSETLIEALVQFCRPYIYTTAMPASIALASLKSLELIKQEGWRRQWLNEQIGRFREHCDALNFSTTDSVSPVQAILLGAAETALKASEFLLSKGVYVSAIRPPTVPKGSSRLRLTLSAGHSKEQFQSLLNVLSELSSFVGGPLNE